MHVLARRGALADGENQPAPVRLEHAQYDARPSAISRVWKIRLQRLVMVTNAWLRMVDTLHATATPRNSKQEVPQKEHAWAAPESLVHTQLQHRAGPGTPGNVHIESEMPTRRACPRQH